MIEVEIQDKAFTECMARLNALGRNPRPALTKIGRSFKTLVQLCFKKGRDPYGARWEPLKLRKGEPLRKTRRLMNSIFYRVDGQDVAVGTNVKYAPTHQYGAEIEPLPGQRHKWIKPKKAKALKITLKGGRVIFRKGARRPPMLAFKVGKRWFYAMKVKIPARPFLPTETDWLPSDWEAAVKRIFNQEAGVERSL